MYKKKDTQLIHHIMQGAHKNHIQGYKKYEARLKIQLETLKGK
jgi:hypothetical protein